MATGTVPAAVPGPPDPPAQPTTNTAPADPPKGFLAAVVAPVEPARPVTFDIVPTDGTSDPAAGADGVLDRSAPGVSSASFRGAAEDAAKASDPTGARAKKSIWKEFWLAAAARWAKGGGATNKRLDLAKARAQAKAHQVKENRTTTVAKSGGLPVRNTGGSGSGTNKGSDKSRNNSSGRNTNGAGRGGSGGGSGNNGAGGNGAGRGSGGSGRSKDTNSSSKHPKRNHAADGASGGSGAGGGRGPSGGTGKDASGSTWSTDGKNGQGLAPRDGRKGAGTGPGASGGAGKAGKAGKDGAPGKPGTGADSKDAKGDSKKVSLTKAPKDPKDSTGKPPADPATQNGPQKPSKPNGKTDGTENPPQQPGTPKTPLQKARETGHGDGTKARRAVDHVKAYKDGVRDGWDDEKTKNEKEHDRLDKAHDTHKPKDGGPQGVIVTEQEDDGVTTDVKPLTVKTIDANTLTLGTAGARTTVGRRELRNFKQYERKLEAKETVLQKIAEACTQLQKEAENESKDCQQLAEQAKGVKGGEKLVGKLDKLAEAAKNQAVQAAELAKRAARAAEICKVVLTNIQTRYAPLYKAVVDSDETKPAELRFYNDKGSYASAA